MKLIIVYYNGNAAEIIDVIIGGMYEIRILDTNEYLVVPEELIRLNYQK